jgi:hypothetical protein
MEAKEFFTKIALSSGINLEDANSDLTDSITQASAAAQSPSAKQNSMDVYWSVFFKNYSIKCQRRWSSQAIQLNDDESKMNLWHLFYEPLWSAGCDVAKQYALQNMSNYYSISLAEKADKRYNDKEDTTSLFNNMLADLDREMTKRITEYQESQRKSMLQGLSKLNEVDEAPFLKKSILLIKSYIKSHIFKK